MTHPGGGSNEINLAAMWVPVMPETSNLQAESVHIGRTMKSGIEQGLNSGQSPEAMGSSFGQRFSASASQAMSRFELPAGLSSAVERFSGQVDEKLINKLKGQASDALRTYRQEYDNLSAAQERAANAENKVAAYRKIAFDNLDLPKQQALVQQYGSEAEALDHVKVKATALLPIQQEAKAAQSELTQAHSRTGAALEDYNGKITALSGATKEAAGASATMAGLMGGLVVAGVQQLSGAVTSLVEHLIEGGVEAFRMGAEGAKEFADKMIELGETYHNVDIQIQEFSSASGDRLEEFTAHAQAVFGQLDVAGENTGKTMAQFASMLDAEPGPALDRLTKHVEELQGRYTDIKGTDLASIFVAFKTPVQEADTALASLLQSARNSGQDLGQLATSLSGDVSYTLKEAGLNLEQAGAFTAKLMEMGTPGRSVMMGLQSAMKEFGKDGLSFSDGMKMAAQRLQELGNTAEGQDLAEKLFGTRRWIVAKDAVQEYLSIVQQGPDAFNASAGSLDDFITRTRTLQNEWEQVKHRAEEAFLPMGEEAVSLVSTGLDSLLTYVNTHMDQIKHAVILGGLEIIKFARDIQVFGQGLLMFFAPIADAITNVMYAAIEGLSGFAKIAGELLSLNPLTHDMGEGLKQAGEAGGHFGDMLKNMQVGDKMRELAEWSKQHPIDVDKASESWTHFAEHVSDAMDSATGSVDKSNSWFGNAGGGVPGVNAPPGFSIGGNASGPGGMPGAPPGFSIGSGAAVTSKDQKGIALAIYNTVKSAGYSDDTALAAVADAMHESSLNPENENHEKGLHEGLFQTSSDKKVGKDPNAQIVWFLEQLKSAGGPGVVDRDPANIIADQIERGGYSGSVYDIAGAKKILGMQGGGYPVTRGSGSGDDVPALLRKGEYVWDTDTVDKYGWLISALHQGAMGFDEGGNVSPYGRNTLDQAILYGVPSGHYADPGEKRDDLSKGLADCSSAIEALVNHLEGGNLTAPSGMYTGNEAQWLMSHGFVPGEGGPGDFRVGFNSHHTQATLPGGTPFNWGSEQAAQNRGIGGTGADDPAFTSHYYMPLRQGADGQYPGLPGQYGGYGTYGGETEDQRRSAEKAVQEAKDRAADLDYTVQENQKRIDDLKAQIASVGVSDKISPLTKKPYPLTPDEQARADEKRKGLNEQLDAATHQLAVSQRERSEQDANITDAERKQQEAMYKKPTGTGTTRTEKPVGAEAFAQLGSSFLGGIGQELGFGDLFAKPPWEWGAVKLLTGAASWAMGTANAWADEIGKGHTGMTGFQPIEGWDQPGGSGSSMLSGLAGSMGLNIPMPKASVSNAPNVVAGQPNIAAGQGTGPAPGPMVQGDYMPINVQAGVDPGQILQPVQELKNSQESTLHGISGGFHP